MKSYYASVSGYKDELLWAGMWLYKATDNDNYLQYVINNAHSFGGIGWAITEFSWDVKYAGLQVMASMVKFSSFFPFHIQFRLVGVPIFSPLLFLLFLSSQQTNLQDLFADYSLKSLEDFAFFTRFNYEIIIYVNFKPCCRTL